MLTYWFERVENFLECKNDQRREVENLVSIAEQQNFTNQELRRMAATSFLSPAVREPDLDQ